MNHYEVKTTVVVRSELPLDEFRQELSVGLELLRSMPNVCVVLVEEVKELPNDGQPSASMSTDSSTT